MHKLEAESMSEQDQNPHTLSYDKWAMYDKQQLYTKDGQFARLWIWFCLERVRWLFAVISADLQEFTDFAHAGFAEFCLFLEKAWIYLTVFLQCIAESVNLQSTVQQTKRYE